MEQLNDKLLNWLSDLTPEAKTSLEKTINAILTQTVFSNLITGFEFSNDPRSEYKFADFEISDEEANRNIDALSHWLSAEKISRNIDPYDLERIFVTDEACRDLKSIKFALQNNTSVKNLLSEFDDTTATLTIDKETIQLPPTHNEHYFCRAIYQYLINEPIDWEVIYEKITGLSRGDITEKHKEDWRKVYDTCRSINKRLLSKNLPELLHWQEKTVKRLY